MGTRSRIAIRNPDNTFTSVYCHWDGYPSHHGPILQEAYDTEDKVRQLLAGGDFSSLSREVNKVEYYAKRGEQAPAETSADLDELKTLTQDTGGEWLYVFTPAGWQCAKGGFSAFGLPASQEPGDLESVDYWIQRQLADERADQE